MADVANDGQTLAGQTPAVQALFNGNSAQWVAEHNAAIGGGGQPAPLTGNLTTDQQSIMDMFAASAGMDQKKLDETVREFNQKYGLDEAALTGTFNGAPTLAATKQAADIAAQNAGLTGTFNGAPTVDEQKVQQAGGLGVLDLLSKLTGPANAFQQQAVLHGLNASGLSNAVGAIQGQYGLPRFEAPQANPQAASLSSLMNQVGGATGWAGAPASGGSTGGASSGSTGSSSGGGSALNPADGGQTVYGGTHIYLPTNAAGAPATLDDTTANYVNNLPAPNKINGTNWMQLDKPTQDFLTSAYGAAGYSPDQVTGAVAAGLPQFKAPAGGAVSPGPVQG